MKKLLTAALLMSLVFAASANTNWTYNAGTILMSKYYGTIFGGTFYDGPMSFTDFNAVRKNFLGDFTLTAMAGQKLDHVGVYNKDGGNEYDVGFSQTFKFGPKSYPVLVNAGVLYLFLYDLGRTHDDAFDETVRFDFPLRADLTNGPILQPYFQIFHYHMVGNGMEDKGWIGYAGLIRDQKLGVSFLGSSELTLNLDYRMGLNFGVYGSNPGIEYHRLAVSLPFQYGKWSLTPSVIGQLQGGKDQTYVHKNELFYTFSIRYNF